MAENSPSHVSARPDGGLAPRRCVLRGAGGKKERCVIRRTELPSRRYRSMRLRFRRMSGLLALLLLAVAALSTVTTAMAADLKGGRLRVAILADMTNFDPMQFSTVNFPLIKNLYDSLLEYTPDGKAVPSLATSWKIAPDNGSVTVTLRTDVKFQSGGALNAEAVAATLKKAADPQKGKNVYATMSFVKDWT